MLLELYDFGYEARALQIFAGLLLGLVFGVAAQISRFCLRRAVAGPVEERASAGAVWMTALATAVLGVAGLTTFGLIDLGAHRFLSGDVSLLAIILGGLAFGVGMALTRGCISRLTVLSTSGNLRAVFVILILAVFAHATLKGVLAPVRLALGEFTVALPVGSVAASPLGQALLALLVVAAAVALIWRARPNAFHVVLGAVIGLVVAGSWAATSVLLLDEFDPLPVQMAGFMAPWSDTLFWTIASSAVPANFGIGFIGGVLGGSFLSAALRGELQLQSFETPAQTLRYGLGGALMGVGGVIAGGCTVGAGLSGVATGSVAAMLALASIAVGAWVAGNAVEQGQAVPVAA